MNTSKTPAIICDLDGTLATLNGRKPYDWARVGEDTVDTLVRDALRRYNTDHSILIVTGRMEQCQGLTLNWLVMNDVPFDVLYMRKDDDFRQDAEFKTELYHQMIEQTYAVRLCLDDRDSSVTAWRMLGLPCWQVAPGNF